MQGAGLTRRQAMTAVAVVHAALLSGELHPHDSLVSGLLGWWRAGAKVKAKPKAKGEGELGCLCGGACGPACQCASPRQPASEAR